MKSIINFLFFFILVILPAYYLPPAAYCLYAEDKIVAIVNNEIITQKDLNDFLNFMRMQFSRELKGKALEEKLSSMKLDLLRRLIDERIMLQKAKEEKITIDPARVKAKISDVKSRYSLESDFELDLAKQGLVQADLENKIREQMLVYAIIEQKVRSKVVIRPDEITGFYNQNKREFLKPEERLLTVIIVQDESLAKTISYQLRLGIKLEELAGKYSFNTDILSVSEGQELRHEIEDKVFKLGIGEVSDPIGVQQQYYIFKLDSIVGSQQMSLAQAQDKIRAILIDKKTQSKMTEWLDELKKQSYIKIIES
ncbi:MAG: peptidyl-prolyl cis-trans isomerase [Candidatus Omnitrophica bacterium]|jgi:parvulin-like peptidyl-prolyl isomerase|nr:peptidyl-prolyl cis-trans isomerase [Candidatus Omnitrophota bacterium]MDD5660418.1 peptidyl-prolyl cis-trans isomerase [Candidatus Omnitrophota bacterium]